MAQIELLAPAKDFDVAIAAINSGADAVYIGAERFGARVKAANSLDNIKRLIEYAHLFNVKVYVVLNTILFDKELNDVEKLINNLYEIKADALIIQDMGILKLNIPPIPIFASTQCHNFTVDKIKFFEDIGLKRVILPREFSLDEIKNVTQHTNIDIETFVHGALCVSYSGQCYMSYTQGKRSSNRGECAQPCRKKYSLITEDGKYLAKDKHLLSLKDLNLSKHLLALLDAGVTSFKIEGRLKDINYVKNTVLYYRKKLDDIFTQNHNYSMQSKGKIITDFIPNLEKTFNRGFTDFFINGRQKDIACLLTPKNKGELVGELTYLSDNKFRISNPCLNIADGISYFSQNNELMGTTIIKKEKDYYLAKDNIKAAKGSKIYRNLDFEYLKKLQNTKITRKLPVNINVCITEEKIVFEACSQNINIVYEIDNNFELAKNQDKAKETFIKQLSKIGDTKFCLEKFDLISTTKMPFVAISTLNEIRRTFLELLSLKILSSYEVEHCKIDLNNKIYPEKFLNYSANISNKLAQAFYVEAGAKIEESAAECGINLKNKTIMTTKHCILNSLGLCKKENNYIINSRLFIIENNEKKYELIVDCINCQNQINLL